MAKTKKEKEKKYSLKDMIKYMKLNDDDEILIHLYNKQLTQGPVCVKDIEPALLKKKIMVVHPKEGGKEYNYSLWKFIVE